jgi:fumarate hydratase class II
MSTAPRWGEQTQRAIDNFPVSGDRVPRSMIEALAMIKAESAAVNRELGTLAEPIAMAIRQAADEIVAGEMVEQFPVDVFQTGSGTSTNMNLNEVIANRASELLGESVHPNDHVNASQSSNDTFLSGPNRRRSATQHHTDPRPLSASCVTRRPRPAPHEHHQDGEDPPDGRGADHVRAGGSGWARSVELSIARITSLLPHLTELPSVGRPSVRASTHRTDSACSCRTLEPTNRITFTEAVNHFEAQSSQDALVEAGAILKVVALSLHKIAATSAAGLGTQRRPVRDHASALQAGARSCLEGQSGDSRNGAAGAAQVVGNDATISFAATMSTLQLNTAMPITARSLLSSIHLLANATTLLDVR